MMFASCNDFFESVVELDVPEHESKLAVTAVLGNEDTRYRKLLVSYSVGGLDEPDDEQLVNNAVVSIGSTQLEYTGNEGIYALPAGYAFEAGETYTLQVEAPDFTGVQATQVYPSNIQIDMAEVNAQSGNVSFHDPLESRDAYMINLYQKDIDNQWQKIEIWPKNTATNTESYEGGILIHDELFNGEDYSMSFEYPNYGDGEQGNTDNGIYKVVLSHFNRDFYQYVHTVNLNQEAEGNPFAEPVIIYSNVKNGYGLFALTNQSEYIIE
jgi:hypothetical protein